MKKLNPKQKRFCEEYVIDLNATQSAIRAGYSKKTAGVSGWEILKKPYISEYIAKLRQDMQDRTKITADNVLNRVNDLATESEDDNTKLRANDMLMKHLGLYEKDNKQSAIKINAIEVKFVKSK